MQATGILTSAHNVAISKSRNSVVVKPAPRCQTSRSVSATPKACPHQQVVSRNFLGNVSLFAGSTKSPEASLKLAAQCMADDVEAVASGTPVKKTSILVLGATGTLGRQVVRRALDEGYDVRCIVRPRQNPADFLRDWGAVTVRADLTKPESIPPALVGIHTVIDCATARPEESITEIDWTGKCNFIQSCKAMGIERYVFCSIDGCEQHPEVPLMDVKRCTELYLKEIGMKHTVLRLCGFMQALIQQYAVPILEEQSVWGTDNETKTAYLDTQDVARMTLAAVGSEACVDKTLTLAGPDSYTIAEVIEKCEKLAGSEAQVTKVPVSLIKTIQSFTSFFQWTRDASDRLAFAEVLSDSNKSFSAPMAETYELLGLDPKDTTTLDSYLGDFYARILKKLKEVGGAQSKQKDFYL